jgi:hypothetical protein
MPYVASKQRYLAGSRNVDTNAETGQVLASATATAYPTFPTGPTDGVVLFAGDMKGADVVGAIWNMTVLTTFTAADATLQVSEDGTTWETYKAFTQKSAIGSELIEFDQETDGNAPRYWRVLLDMTGTPGTSTHIVKLLFRQVGPRGEYAPPGKLDRNS